MSAVAGDETRCVSARVPPGARRNSPRAALETLAFVLALVAAGGGALIGQTAAGGFTGLHHAASGGHLKVVEAGGFTVLRLVFYSSLTSGSDICAAEETR